MKASIKARLDDMRQYFAAMEDEQETFITEDGEIFRTSKPIFEYLHEYGAYTPAGRRIISYPHPTAGLDPLSMSLYEFIDAAIADGGKLFCEPLESDPI